MRARHRKVRRIVSSAIGRYRLGTMFSLIAASLVGGCSPSGSSLSEAAEARETVGANPAPARAVALIEPLPACSAGTAVEAMDARPAARRAAGALCAADWACDEAVRRALNRLLSDTAVAAEHVDSGTILGGGDQRVQYTVGYYARYALDRSASSLRVECKAPAATGR